MPGHGGVVGRNGPEVVGVDVQRDGLWVDARGRPVCSPRERRQPQDGPSPLSLRLGRMRAALRVIASFGGQQDDR